MQQNVHCRVPLLFLLFKVSLSSMMEQEMNYQKEDSLLNFFLHLNIAISAYTVQFAL